MTETDALQLTRYNCVNCPNKIPLSRFRRKAATCSDKCANELKKIRRLEREAKYCRLCCKPSTPEQRALYRQFVKTLPKKKLGRRPKAPAEPIEEIVAIPQLEEAAHECCVV